MAELLPFTFYKKYIHYLFIFQQGDKGVIEYRFCSTSEEALFLYTHLYNEKLQAPHNMELVHDMFSRHIGSEKFQQVHSVLQIEGII